ncbi:MAG: hypothetical protein FJ390_08135 [Verrucomicrobia bacterium]|nr:hypothetical protein [Verrucomicrobiota bacterium]
MPIYAWPGEKGVLEKDEKRTTARKDTEAERAKTIIDESNTSNLAEEHKNQEVEVLKGFSPLPPVSRAPLQQLREKQERYDKVLEKIKKQDGALAKTLNRYIQKDKSTFQPITIELLLDQWFPPEPIWFGFGSKAVENFLKTQCRQALQIENQMKSLRKQACKPTFRTVFNGLIQTGNLHLISDPLVASVEKERNEQLAQSQKVLTAIKNIDSDLVQQIKNVTFDAVLDDKELSAQINEKIDQKNISEEQKNILRTQCYQALGERVIDQLLSVADLYRGAFMTYADEKPNSESDKEGINQYLDKFRAIEPVNKTIEHLQQNAIILRAILERLLFLPKENRPEFISLLETNVCYAEEISVLLSENISTALNQKKEHQKLKPFLSPKESKEVLNLEEDREFFRREERKELVTIIEELIKRSHLLKKEVRGVKKRCLYVKDSYLWGGFEIHDSGVMSEDVRTSIIAKSAYLFSILLEQILEGTSNLETRKMLRERIVEMAKIRESVGLVSKSYNEDLVLSFLAQIKFLNEASNPDILP